MYRPKTRLGALVRGGQHRAEFGLYRAAALAVRVLPLPARRRLGALVGRALFFSGQARRVAERNFAIAFPGRDPAEARAVLEQAALQNGWNLMDLLRSEAWDAREILTRVGFEGVEHVKQALGRGRGAVALIPHLGNYELAMRAVPLVGLQLAVVSRALHNPLVQEHMARQRTRTGGVLIPHHDAMNLILRYLRAGSLVAILNDQYSKRSHSILSPFLGVAAWTSPGPALAALRARAPIVPCCMLRDGPDHQTLHFFEPLEPRREGDLREDLQALTDAMNARMEAMIRAHPDQWVWTHRRFRHSPDLPGDPYRPGSARPRSSRDTGGPAQETLA